MADKDSVPEPGGERPIDRPTSAEAEQRYQRLSRRAVVVTVVVVVVVLGAAVFLGAGAISRRFKGARNLDQALTLTQSADGVVLDVDEVVRSQASSVTAEKARQLKKKLPATRRDLEKAQVLIASATDSVTEDEQKHAALLRASVLARLAMLEPADTILDANVKAGLAIAPSQDGWETLLAAESLADRSVREFNGLKQSNAKQFQRTLSQATARFQRARQYFSQAATAFPEAGIDRYVAFVDGEVATLAILKQSGAAALKGDVIAANAALKRYEAKEAAAEAIAQTLPATPSKAVADAYEKLAGQATSLYSAARKNATAADAQLDAF